MSIVPVLPLWLLGILAAGVLAVTVLALRSGSRTARRGALLRAAAALLILGACLRPGIPDGQAETATVELDVFLVVDSSLSMVAEDFGDGTRLDGVRDDVEAITEHFAGARFALLTFDAVGRVRMPLTLDADAVRAGVDVIVPAPSMNARGSSTTSGGPTLEEQLEDARTRYPHRPNLVFYFGDGEDTSPSAAERLGIDAGLVDGGAVLGYGTEAGGRMLDVGGDGEPVRDSLGDPAVSKLDEERLRGLAGELDLPYAHRTPGASADTLFSATAEGALEAGTDPGAARVELTWILAVLAFLAAMAEPARRIVEVRELMRTSRTEQ